MAMSAKLPTGWIQLATELAQWFVQQLRSNGIRSPKEIKEKQKELSALTFSKYSQHSHTEKFQVGKDKVEGFIQEYFSNLGFDKLHVDQLIIQAKYVNQGRVESKVFEFVLEEGGKYRVFYVALMAEGDMFYIALTSSQFQFVLSPTYKGWWIFTRKEYRQLTPHEQKSLQNFFLYEALHNCYQSLIVDITQLPQEDRKFLEFNE